MGKEILYFNVSKMYKFNNLLDNASTVEEILNVLVTTVNQVIPKVDMSIVYLYNTQKNVLSLEAGTGIKTSILGKIAFQPGESLTGKVFLRKETLYCSNHDDVSEKMANISNENLKWFQEGTYRRVIKSSINVPLMNQNQCIGTFTLNRHNTDKHFTEEDIALLHSLTSQAAKMIGYIRMSKALEDSYMKEKFSRLLIENKGKDKIITLLEHELNTKFFLESPDAKPNHYISIIHNQNMLGYLTTTKAISNFSLNDQKIIHYAVDALGVELTKDLNSYEKELQTRSKYFNRLINGDYNEELIKYLKFKKDELMYCFAIPNFSQGNPSFARYLENIVHGYYPDSTLFISQSYYIVLSPYRNNLKDLAKYLHTKHGLIIGVGKPRTIQQLHISYQEAIIASKQTTPPLVEYSSLGYKRLLDYLDDHVKHEFVEDHINTLLKLSPDHLTTLGALIENGRTEKNKTADQLYIHINTLYQRLRRIENSLGVSFQNENQWINIVIAYELYVDLYTHSK